MSFNCQQEIILENGRAKLLPLQMTHLDQLLSITAVETDLVQYSPSAVYNAADLRQYIESGLSDRASSKHYPFLVFDKQSNRVAGTTRFANISNKNRTAEIGWTWIGKDFQSSGLNTNMKFLMLPYAFEDLLFERIEFKADANNQQSRRAMEKIGAQFEGTLRSHVLMLDGRRRDTVYYSIIKSEWPTVRQQYFQKLR